MIEYDENFKCTFCKNKIGSNPYVHIALKNNFNDYCEGYIGPIYHIKCFIEIAGWEHFPKRTSEKLSSKVDEIIERLKK